MRLIEVLRNGKIENEAQMEMFLACGYFEDAGNGDRTGDIRVILSHGWAEIYGKEVETEVEYEVSAYFPQEIRFYTDEGEEISTYEDLHETTEAQVLEDLRALIGKPEWDADDIYCAFGDFTENGKTEIILDETTFNNADWMACIDSEFSVMEFLIYTDAVGCARLKDARFHAQTAALDAGCVEIYDSETSRIVETFYTEELL